MPTCAFPHLGCCCGCRRGAALLALSVSVRGQPAAADATVTVARRWSGTIVSDSLKTVLTPLCSMIGAGFSWSRWARSVPANDIIGRWLIHSCRFEELEGSRGMILTSIRMRKRGGAIVVGLVDLVG